MARHSWLGVNGLQTHKDPIVTTQILVAVTHLETVPHSTPVHGAAVDVPEGGAGVPDMPSSTCVSLVTFYCWRLHSKEAGSEDTTLLLYHHNAPHTVLGLTVLCCSLIHQEHRDLDLLVLHNLQSIYYRIYTHDQS